MLSDTGDAMGDPGVVHGVTVSKRSLSRLANFVLGDQQTANAKRGTKLWPYPAQYTERPSFSRALSRSGRKNKA
jgi:hypothetical protein